MRALGEALKHLEARRVAHRLSDLGRDRARIGRGGGGVEEAGAGAGVGVVSAAMTPLFNESLE
ncbi:hypothetical protein GCM10025873_10560 [Demequina sediminis]|nr:hypothetical protein GCM10025873_10560 [Demequina sediminis]